MNKINKILLGNFKKKNILWRQNYNFLKIEKKEKENHNILRDRKYNLVNIKKLLNDKSHTKLVMILMSYT